MASENPLLLWDETSTFITYTSGSQKQQVSNLVLGLTQGGGQEKGGTKERVVRLAQAGSCVAGSSCLFLCRPVASAVK